VLDAPGRRLQPSHTIGLHILALHRQSYVNVGQPEGGVSRASGQGGHRMAEGSVGVGVGQRVTRLKGAQRGTLALVRQANQSLRRGDEHLLQSLIRFRGGFEVGGSNGGAAIYVALRTLVDLTF